MEAPESLIIINFRKVGAGTRNNDELATAKLEGETKVLHAQEGHLYVNWTRHLGRTVNNLTVRLFSSSFFVSHICI